MKLFVFIFAVLVAFKTSAATTVLAQSQQQQEKTLEGPDLDGNGVWDYIDQYINRTVSDDPSRLAEQQLARAIQSGLQHAADKKLSLQYAQEMDRAIECLFFLHKREAASMVKNLKAAILNTSLRTKTFMAFSDQSGGQVFRSTPLSKLSSSCAGK